MRDFEGRVVLITGAASGIGRAHALYFAENGAHVLIHDRDAPRIQAVAETIEATGGCAKVVLADVADSESFRAAIEQVAAHEDIDVLVNNVGIAADCPVEEITAESFDLAFRINVLSTIIATQAVLPKMKERRRGKIILTSSNWALTGQEDSSLYSATKAALLGLTKSWAREFAPWNIHVNCVAPGGINTVLLQTSEARLQKIPLRRHGEPAEVSYVVGFLASAKSDYMTGSVLNLTGGELITGC